MGTRVRITKKLGNGRTMTSSYSLSEYIIGGILGSIILFPFKVVGWGIKLCFKVILFPFLLIGRLFGKKRVKR